MSENTFPSLRSALTLINVKRAEKGLAQIIEADWSAFLSGVLGNPVRKIWIRELLAGRPIPAEKALAVLAAVNAALKHVNEPLLKADVLKEKKAA